MTTVPCKLCGRPIIWAVDRKGQRIPLDPKPAVYHVFVDNGVLVAERDRPSENMMGAPMAHLVSHFATCPNVGDLKRK